MIWRAVFEPHNRNEVAWIVSNLLLFVSLLISETKSESVPIS